MNKIQLIGHLGRDPEVRSTASGDRVVSFSIATSERWRDKTSGEKKERTQWFNVSIWNENLGKVAENYLKKGHLCRVEGQMLSREYTDKDGNTRTAWDVVLQRFRGELELLERAEREAPSEDDYGKTRTRETDGGGLHAGGDPDDSIPF